MRIDEDTIVALATPPGIGAVSIVRLSGERAIELAAEVFRCSNPKKASSAAASSPGGASGISFEASPSHLLRHGWLEIRRSTSNIADSQHQHPKPNPGRRVRIDEALAVIMRAPRSYTAEDVVELHCHGGVLLPQLLISELCQRGARLARAGEFTLRAFLNGKLDLTQVEAVNDIIQAQAPRALESSVAQLRGHLHQVIEALRARLRRVAALIAASIDFPEDDVVFSARTEVVEALSTVQRQLAQLLAQAPQGRMLQQGLRLALCGRPNVGKSSLLNALLGRQRAIVSATAGTTRDTLEAPWILDGLAIHLVDTAGLRQSEDAIEQEGVRRAQEALTAADFALLVLDASEPLTPTDHDLLATQPADMSLVVLNKADRCAYRPPPWTTQLARATVLLSAREKWGIAALETELKARLLEAHLPHHHDHALLTNARQEHAARRAWEAVSEALAALEVGHGEELLALDLERSLHALGEIVGETTADDLLESIFAEFCIGK